MFLGFMAAVIIMALAYNAIEIANFDL